MYESNGHKSGISGVKVTRFTPVVNDGILSLH